MVVYPKLKIWMSPLKIPGAKKLNCPFELVGKYSKTCDVWKLRVVRDEHNHQPALYLEGHAYAMRLTRNEYRLLQDLTKLNVKPRDIWTTLRQQNVNNVSSLKTIYNARHKFRMTEQAGRTRMQNLFFIFQSKGYVFEYRTHHVTYVEKFVSVWTDRHLNFGNSSTNRVESQHAKLKKHLDTTKCDLDRFVLVIENIVKSQEAAVKESLERSRSTYKTRYNKPIFQQLKGFVSHHAMKKILYEVDRSQCFGLTVDNCGCQLRSCFGLPCAHELAMYVGAGLSIPLDCIDPFWRKLDLLPSIHVDYGDVGYEKDVEMFKEIFNKQSNSGKSSLLRKLREIFDPSANLIAEPLVKKNNRGRPKMKHVHHPNQVPHRHSFSNFGKADYQEVNKEPPRHSSLLIELNEEPHMMELNMDPLGHISYPNFKPFNTHPLMDEIPKIFRPYVTHIQNVQGYGNCGFRSIAACLVYGEDHWCYIKEQLLEELLNAYSAYQRIFPSGIREVYTTLAFSESPAPEEHWMIMPETGILIANKFGVVVHNLSIAGCITCFPMWNGPEEFQHHQMITIAHVYGNHYVMVQLVGEYPMPCASSYWVRHRSPSAVGWQNVYAGRLEFYKQLNPCRRDKAFIHIEDDC